MGTEIKVSPKSWKKKKKYRRSCRDSNPRRIDHESGALTTELFPLSNLFVLLKKRRKKALRKLTNQNFPHAMYAIIYIKA